MHSFSLNIFRRIPGHPNGSTQSTEFLPSIPQLIPVTVFCIVETQNFASPRFRVHPIDGFFYSPIFRYTNARRKMFRPSLKHRPKKDSLIGAKDVDRKCHLLRDRSHRYPKIQRKTQCPRPHIRGILSVYIRHGP